MSAAHEPKMSYSAEYLAEYDGSPLHVVSIFFIVVSILCVALRFYAHRVANVAWGLDDALTIPGKVFCLNVCICSLSESNVAFTVTYF